MEGLSTSTDVKEEGLNDNPRDALPPYMPHIQDLKQYSQEYYDSRDVIIVTLQRILKALIMRSSVIEKLCKDLQRDDHDNIVINVYPIFANSVNLQGGITHQSVKAKRVS
jgi:hypothetical protein